MRMMVLVTMRWLWLLLSWWSSTKTQYISTIEHIALTILSTHLLLLLLHFQLALTLQRLLLVLTSSEHAWWLSSVQMGYVLRSHVLLYCLPLLLSRIIL